jgi:hypothetical protein
MNLIMNIIYFNQADGKYYITLKELKTANKYYNQFTLYWIKCYRINNVTYLMKNYSSIYGHFKTTIYV